MKRIFLTVFMLLLAPAAFAATYYVSNTGLDENPGSETKPFASIQKGVDTATVPGDTVIVEDGIYKGVTMTAWSGTEGRPITLKARNRGKVFIDASTLISGWTSIGMNRYRSAASTNTNLALWRAGDTVALKRCTSEAAVDMEGEYYFDATTKQFTIYTATKPETRIYKQLLNPLMIYSISWIVIDGITFQYGNSSVGTTTNTSGPPTAQILVQYCTFEYGSGLGVLSIPSSPARNTNYITVDQCTVRNSDDVYLQNGHGIKFAANVNEANGSYVTVSNCTIYNCLHHGIQFSNGWSEGTFFNNRIYNFSLRGNGAASGIRTGTPSPGKGGCYIYGNDIGNGPGGEGPSLGSAIYVQENTNLVRIHHNRLHNNYWHGIYVFSTTGSPCFDVQICNNLIYDNGTAGIRVEVSKSVEILNNTFYRNGTTSQAGSGACLSINGVAAQGVVFRNNIVYNPSGPGYLIAGITNAPPIASDHNVLFKASASPYIHWAGADRNFGWWKATANQDLNSYNEDPQFKNAATRDLSVLTGSPAQNHGLNFSQHFTDDFVHRERGTAWDIGAYEASVDNQPPGEPKGPRR
jgi:hypothetical protein